MQVADAESNLYYVDLPTDVIAVIFNNALNGGERIVDDYGNVTYEFSEVSLWLQIKPPTS